MMWPSRCPDSLARLAIPTFWLTSTSRTLISRTTSYHEIGRIPSRSRCVVSWRGMRSRLAVLFFSVMSVNNSPLMRPLLPSTGSPDRPPARRLPQHCSTPDTSPHHHNSPGPRPLHLFTIPLGRQPATASSSRFVTRKIFLPSCGLPRPGINSSTGRLVPITSTSIAAQAQLSLKIGVLAYPPSYTMPPAQFLRHRNCSMTSLIPMSTRCLDRLITSCQIRSMHRLHCGLIAKSGAFPAMCQIYETQPQTN